MPNSIVPVPIFPAPLVYICGVTAKWEWNVHVAGRLELRLENFRRIEIRPDLGPPAHKAFSTCRNWQFGWIAFRGTPRDVELKQ